ncbi:MAG: ATP-binding cassette domain-containing protein [Betaproteobacteria bacterium]|nr:ATP-binding cassette domain-containing protein [Betaproteobacteria bacterium]
MGEAALVGEAGALLRVSEVCKRYGPRRAVDGISLEVRRGETYGLIGPDGAGKSSLLKAIAGVLAFEAGRIEVFGVSLESERAAERVKGRLGFMPQGLGLNLYPELSVEENVDFFARLRLVAPEDLAQRKRRLLALTRLEAFRARPMKQLSGGMKQKLALVCTLIHEPELIILDEPTTGVDPVSRRDFWVILSELLHERGATALVSTAYMDEASRFDRLSLLHEGRVLAAGSPEGLSAMGGGPTRAADLEDVFVALLGAEARAPRAAPPVPARGGEAPAILASDLTRDFDGFRAVDRVSFRVRAGEIFGLLGANGAGKTTVIKMLTGILPPTSGSGQVGGAEMRRAGRAIKQRIGYVSQAFSLYSDLTVIENIRLYAGIYGLDGAEARRRTDWALEMGALGGHEKDIAGRLPVGLRQRLALGCALLHRPQVLFLDEPTSGVDPIGRRQFWDILFALSRGEGVAVLVTTHYMMEAEHCDRLALMFAGRIVSDAPPAALKEAVEREAGQLLEVSVDRPLAALPALERAGFADVALFGRRIHLLAPEPERARAALEAALAAADVSLEAVAPLPLSLEDVFVHRVRGLEREAVRAGRRAA